MKTVNSKSKFLGEVLGTFILIIFGCGANTVSTIFDVQMGLMQVALLWGIGVILAIYLTRHICCAHFNPAVSVAMVISGRMPARRLPTYILGQLVGAFLAGLVLYLLFSSSIANYEASHHIIRGSSESVKTARMFGPFYTLADGQSTLSLSSAVGIEIFGTFLLLLFVFALSEGANVGRPDVTISPVFIGLVVTAIICLLGPLTQSGLNPARDIGPRMVTWIFGWGDAAFTGHKAGFLLVYTLAPIVGASLAAFFFVKILEPMMLRAGDTT